MLGSGASTPSQDIERGHQESIKSGGGALLAFHMGLFHMGKTATILGAMLLLVGVVDLLSYGSRRVLTR